MDMQEPLKTKDPEKGFSTQDDYRIQNYPGTGSIKDVQVDCKK